MKPWILFILLYGSGSAAFAQETLADLTQMGAKKLSADELKSVLVGSRATGPGRNHSQTDITFQPDGKVSGYISSGGRNFGVTGTYKITEEGDMCAHFDLSGTTSTYDGCAGIYLTNNQYYLSHAEENPKPQVVKRTFTPAR